MLALFSQVLHFGSMDRINAVDRIRSQGAATTFTPVKHAGAAQPFLNSNTQHFVLNLSHTEVPPCTTDGAHIRVLAGFATRDEALRYAHEVHNHDQCSVLISQLHQWILCCNSVERLGDAKYIESKKQHLLDMYTYNMQKLDRETLLFQEVQKQTAVSVTDWLKKIGASDEDSEKILEWATYHGYTYEKCAQMSEVDAVSMGVNRTAIMNNHKRWVDSCTQSAERNLKSLPGKPTPPSHVERIQKQTSKVPSEKPATDSEPVKRFDTSLSIPAQTIAVVLVVPDVETGPLAEPLVKVMGIFESVDAATAYVRNVAGNKETEHNMYTVDMYHWVNPAHATKAPIQHREDELQRIIDVHESQPALIARMEAEHEEKFGAPRGLAHPTQTEDELFADLEGDTMATDLENVDEDPEVEETVSEIATDEDEDGCEVD